ARALPSAVDVAGYRIVQESLTNVVRHAHAHEASVTIDYGPAAVEIEVVDDGRNGAGGGAPGHGIAGMRERAQAVGGQVDAGPRFSGGFRVWARLPAAVEAGLSRAPPPPLRWPRAPRSRGRPPPRPTPRPCASPP